MPRSNVRRLNWGCGGHVLPGWINCDIKQGWRVDLTCDICQGLPLADGSMDYIVSIHALQEVPLDKLLPALRELRRVLAPGGVLRLVLPDLMKGVRAYERGDREYFAVPDSDAQSLGGKLVTQILWYGYSRTLFTADFIEELLRKAGFSRVEHCACRRTTSAHVEIVDLDNRENESLFVEAYK
jgi:SAM-dependent methyltransferase